MFYNNFLLIIQVNNIVNLKSFPYDAFYLICYQTHNGKLFFELVCEYLFCSKIKLSYRITSFLITNRCHAIPTLLVLLHLHTINLNCMLFGPVWFRSVKNCRKLEKWVKFRASHYLREWHIEIRYKDLVIKFRNSLLVWSYNRTGLTSSSVLRLIFQMKLSLHVDLIISPFFYRCRLKVYFRFQLRRSKLNVSCFRNSQ